MPNSADIDELFLQAIRLPRSERTAFVDECSPDSRVRDRLNVLLEAHDEASDFLESPAVRAPVLDLTTQSPLAEGPGTTIGRYKLLELIGEGGFGAVYMADQKEPVRRRVALKIIKLGMDTKQVIARFEAERQALAMMDHPNIAKVLDAGATETGRPYFVMELVKGVHITEYCDTENLSTKERLDLFIKVCNAVQHAHQKGIIHRDLKPSNVLITMHDDRPVPKVIDFGIAKATNRELTDKTLFTEFRQFIGTPEYMSPEQAQMSGLDIDTRSDVYALGVLLYELLTGTTPFDGKTLREKSYAELQRIIREDEPPKPSTRLSTLGDDVAGIAKYRKDDLAHLARSLRGDLDWIVMKALEKNRTRRYETANGFAADIRRHLDNEPVIASPPSATYRFRKLVQRNKGVFAATGTVAAALILGLAVATTGFISAVRSRDAEADAKRSEQIQRVLAEAAQEEAVTQRDEADQQRRRARAEADRSGKISDSLQDVLAMTDPARAADRSDVESVLATVREVFGEDHATFAAVLNTLALQLHDAGDFEAAAELYRESLAVWKKVYGEQHPNVAITLTRLGTSLRAQGDDEQAESALRAALATFDGASDMPGLASYDARIELADLLGNRGEYAEADELLGESLAILRASPSPARFRILETLERRAIVQLNQPSADTRETLRAIYDETHEFYPDDSPVLAIAALGYGRTLFQYGEHEKAEPYLREAIRRFRASAKPPGIYFVAAVEALFQIVRGRDDPESILETDDLLRDLIKAARTFWNADDLATNQKYYASRMVDRERFGDALDALLDGHQALVDAGRSVEERENLRDSLTTVAMKVAVRPDLEPEVYARARDAVERALQEEPDHAAMIVVLGAVLYRQGEFALAAETLDLPLEPLTRYPGGLAGRMAPADHAFRALAHAQLGHDAVARAELEALRAALVGGNAGDQTPPLLREVEALLEHTPSSTGDR